MFQSSAGDTAVSTSFTLPTYQPDKLCHFLLGDYAAVVGAINRMVVLGYCEKVAWIEPIPTGRGGEYISVMSRRYSTAKD